ncbi:hypothetical protein P692DRAFT_20883193 [Suillus brevipes Sb2]|nr:hypothetical protein P692DRAFT_20883193 [Suillus brevipes Sb2]
MAHDRNAYEMIPRRSPFAAPVVGKLLPHAAETIKRTRAGELSIGPRQGQADWYRWLENIQDWCTPRQLSWGHQCPAYFVQLKGEAIDRNGRKSWVVGRTLEEATERAKTLANGKNSRLDEDEDVLDTLFSSGLWVFSILDKRYDFNISQAAHRTVTGRFASFYRLLKMPKEPQLRFIDVRFDPATNVMSQHERGRRKHFRRNIASEGSSGDGHIFFYVPSGQDTAQSDPTVVPHGPASSSLVTPLPLPPPPPPQPPPPPSPPPPPPSPPPPPPSPPTMPSPPLFAQTYPPLSPMAFDHPSPPSSPAPSPQLQMPQPSDVASAPDPLASIVAHLADLQWDLDHPEMWNECIEFEENDEN